MLLLKGASKSPFSTKTGVDWEITEFNTKNNRIVEKIVLIFRRHY